MKLAKIYFSDQTKSKRNEQGKKQMGLHKTKGFYVTKEIQDSQPELHNKKKTI